MAKIARRRLAREVVRLLTEQPERRAEILRQVAAYVVDTKQTGSTHLLLNDIASELLAQQQHVSADVTTAFALNDSTREQIVALLQQLTHAKTVELTENVQPNLLGGVVIRTPQMELDASVRRQLTQLAGGIK